MKNYIHDIISRYIKHDYPKEVDQDFRAWLTDEEHTNEKEQTLNELWENTESVTTPDYQHSLERMPESVQDSGFVLFIPDWLLGEWRQHC